MGPWDSGYAFRNFSERRRRFHDGHAAHRLRSLKALVDGDDLFVGLGRRRRQRERQRLGVGAGAQRVRSADRLLELQRDDVVADRPGVGQQRRRERCERRPCSRPPAAAPAGRTRRSPGGRCGPRTGRPPTASRRPPTRRRSPSSTPCSRSRRPGRTARTSPACRASATAWPAPCRRRRPACTATHYRLALVDRDRLRLQQRPVGAVQVTVQLSCRKPFGPGTMPSAR